MRKRLRSVSPVKSERRTEMRQHSASSVCAARLGDTGKSRMGCAAAAALASGDMAMGGAAVSGTMGMRPLVQPRYTLNSSRSVAPFWMREAQVEGTCSVEASSVDSSGLVPMKSKDRQASSRVRDWSSSCSCVCSAASGASPLRGRLLVAIWLSMDRDTSNTSSSAMSRKDTDTLRCCVRVRFLFL